jgi:hypothetical protein
MRFIQVLPVLTLVVPALCDEVASIISEIAPLITELPSIISEDGGALITDLAVIISQYDPTGIVSDLPGVLATEAPVIESYLDRLITGLIPPGALPTDIIAELPGFVSELVPEIITELDAIITAVFPGSLSDAAIPTLLASLLPEIALEAESIASEALPALSSVLESFFSTAPVNATAQPTTVVTSVVTNITASGGPRSTTTKAMATFTGAASSMAFKAEIAGLAGFAAAVAMLWERGSVCNLKN